MEAKKFIRLGDGTLVEVLATEDPIQQISGSSLAKKIEDATLERVKPILVNACRPIITAWEEVSNVVEIEKIEVELGLSFEGEGNVYITKAKAGANLSIKMIIKKPLAK
jgi:hypothetical protein